MKNLVDKLRRDYPMLDFTKSTRFHWSPKKQQICYVDKFISSPQGQWTILHELGHAISGHNNYFFDTELLKMEVVAWDKAQELAENYNLTINNDYIQDCLDTYRDWIHLRSTCPYCLTINVQDKKRQYNCINCSSSWRVSTSCLNRPYRRIVNLGVSHSTNTPD